MTTSTTKPWLKTLAENGFAAHIDLPDAQKTLLNFLEDAFTKHGNHTAYTCMGASLSYRELDLYSRQIAAYLQSLGLVKGDKVALMMPNVLQYPIIMAAIVRAGLVLVNVNPLYTAHELSHQLQDSGAKAIFIFENFAHTLQKANKGQLKHTIVASMGDLMGLKGHLVNFVVRHVKKMVPDYNLPNAIDFKSALSLVSASRYVRPQLVQDDLAVLQYTGGTTGLSKGAMLSHGNLLCNVLQADAFFSKYFPHTASVYGQHIAIALPMYHIFSFTACALLGIYRGFVGLLIPNPRDLMAVTKDFAKYKPVFFPAVNTLFNALVNHSEFSKLDFSHLRLCLGGGMPILETTAQKWQNMTGRGIIEGYGLSETAPLVSLNVDEVYRGSIGVPVANTEVAILDEQGRALEIGEIGEIGVKGPQVMQGYWQQNEASDAVFVNGYFRTGDIGKMDSDGFIYIVDRKKDMILVSGFNVYPNEVEAVLAKHDKVLECGVIGAPCDKSGEKVKAYVVKKDADLSDDELKKFMREHLTAYKCPREFVFVDELPKSNVGKILRRELRALDDKN